MNNMIEKRERELYNYVALQRPEIQKIGTLGCDIVETTPIVFKDVLYRFEYVRSCWQNESNDKNETYFHFIDVKTNRTTAPFAFNYHFGSAYTDGEYMYAIGIRNHSSHELGWGDSFVQIFRSVDLKSWEEYGQISLPDDMGAYNTGVCKQNDVYTMLIEVDKPMNFCFRFAQSKDMKNWTLLDENYRFHEEPRYAGGPAIYTVDDDPHYYVFYLEEYPGPCYATCIARSKDLKKWTYSPINPVLMFEEKADKKIANPFLTEHEIARIARAMDINNSDLELCEFHGRTIMYYSWGNQLGIEFLAEAAFEGTVKELLQSFFKN